MQLIGYIVNDKIIDLNIHVKIMGSTQPTFAMTKSTVELWYNAIPNYSGSTEYAKNVTNRIKRIEANQKSLFIQYLKEIYHTITGNNEDEIIDQINIFAKPKEICLYALKAMGYDVEKALLDFYQ